MTVGMSRFSLPYSIKMMELPVSHLFYFILGQNSVFYIKDNKLKKNKEKTKYTWPFSNTWYHIKEKAKIVIQQILKAYTKSELIPKFPLYIQHIIIIIIIKSHWQPRIAWLSLALHPNHPSLQSDLLGYIMCLHWVDVSLYWLANTGSSRCRNP